MAIADSSHRRRPARGQLGTFLCVVGLGALANEARQAQVGQQCAVVSAEQHVGAADVAVQQALAVHVQHARRGPAQHLQPRQLGGQPALTHEVVEAARG
jgi:hypothetical protein